MPPTGKHTYESSVTKTPTCATPGTTLFKCTVCGDTDTEDIPIDPNKHEYSKEEILKQANCTDAGQKKLTCIYCGDFIVETLPPIGHSFTKWTVYRPATTEAPGEERCYCDHDCGMYESREIPQLPPEEVPDDPADPPDGGNGGGAGTGSIGPVGAWSLLKLTGGQCFGLLRFAKQSVM